MDLLADMDPASCTSGGEGWGVQSFTIGEETGQERVHHEVRWPRPGFVSGTFTGDRFDGTFTFTPTDGDCFSSPVTKGNIHVESTLHG